MRHPLQAQNAIFLSHTLIQYWKSAKETGIINYYFANEVYFDVTELAECDSYKYARRMGTSEIYRVDLKNGKVSCAEIIGAPEEYQMTYVLRINEEQMLMEFTKNLDEIENAERKWYLVEIDELKFKKVSKSRS